MVDQPTAKLLIAEPPLQVLPSLAVRLGLNESIFVQQLHYTLIQPNLGKLKDGHKWIFKTMEEWRQNFPFWAVNTLRAIINHLVEAKIVLEGNFNETLSRRKWYSLDYDALSEKTIKEPRKLRTDYPNFGHTMKERKKNKPKKVAVSPNFGRSYVQTLDIDSSKTPSKTPENSSDRVLSSEFTEPATQQVATQASVAPVLNASEQEILKVCQSGRAIVKFYSLEAVKHLLALGKVERCKLGLHDALCLPGQAKQYGEETKVHEFQTAIQASFLPGETGRLSDKEQSSPTPIPQPPSPAPALPALPEVLEGYRALFTIDGLRHLVEGNRVTVACGRRIYETKRGYKTKIMYDEWLWKGEPEQCVKCAAQAAARPAKPAKAPREKTPREHDALFVAVATQILHYAPENGTKYTRNQCSQINAIKAVIMQTLAFPEKKTPEDYQRGANTIPKYQAWYKKLYPDQKPTTHDAKFAGYFNEWWIDSQPAKPKDTSCPKCHGELYVLVKDDEGIEVAQSCDQCQKEKTLA